MGVPRGRSPSGKFRMCPDRVHPVQNGMPFCETCPIIPATVTRIFEGCGCGESSLWKSVAFPTFAPEKIIRNLQGDDSGFVIFRRGWVSGKQCSVSEDCCLLVHCRRKITRLRSRRTAPAIFARNINHKTFKDICYICLTHHRFVTQFVKQKYYFFSVV